MVVNEPRGQYYGGLVAAPAFKNIVEEALTYMRVPSRLPEQTILVETGNDIKRFIEEIEVTG